MEYGFDFIGEINDGNIFALINYTKQIPDVTKLTINISSTGGSIFSAITIYNYLKNLPYEIVTHNLGEVSSAAILLYLAGTTRTSEDIAKFMIHPLAIGIHGDLPYNKVNELLKSIDIDIKNYGIIVNDVTNHLKELYDVEHHLKNESLVLNKTQAFECNLITRL